jgi:phospholipid/cholesterol/gamma-HCH transport system substrate-binding protein/paraquat-inducible protein B
MKIFGEELTREQLNHFVKENLRARVKSMGITGVNYIEFDFVKNASEYPPLPFAWDPLYPVMPSMPNETDEIISGIQKFIASANEMNIERTQKKIDDVLMNLNMMMVGDGKGNEGFVRSVKDLNLLLSRIAKVTDKDELNILMRELVGAVTSLRQTITSIQGDTGATLENLKQTSENLNELSRIASQSPASLIWAEPPPKIVLPMNGTQSPAGAQK